MLEVGRVAAPTPDTFLSWNRAHFGAWCITSSPLILGLDITDDQKLTAILDIIGNPDAVSAASLRHPQLSDPAPVPICTA